MEKAARCSLPRHRKVPNVLFQKDREQQAIHRFRGQKDKRYPSSFPAQVLIRNQKNKRRPPE